ncbi:MAG: hypothetical protein OEW89_02565 [Gammaproteobacteria bacterium]|nr:hypothetical protein [Gammaproteobacteria bacterium]
MSVIRKNIYALLGLMLFVVAGNTNAISVNYISYKITGEVVSAGSNPFGLVDGSLVTATGIISDVGSGYQIVEGSLIGGDATGTLAFGAGMENTMTITVGNTVFDASNDVNFGTGSPTFHLTSGVLDGFEILMSAGVNGATDNFYSSLPVGESVFRFGDNDTFVGYWNTGIEIINPNPVPVPAAVWLFGSGLLGLIGFARRK